MTASRSLERSRPAGWLAAGRDHGADLAGLVVRAAGGLAAAASAACGATIAVRRLGGMVGPADPGVLAGVALAGIPLVVAADAARRAGGPLAGPMLARCGLVVAVAVLAWPPRAEGLFGWTTIAAALMATALVSLRWPGLTTGRRPTPPPGEAVQAARRRAVGDGRGSRSRTRRPPPRPGLLRQRFERRELAAGDERVHGRVVVAVPAGGRIGYGHLGFCPAFAATPAVEVSTAYDGVEVIVAAAEVLPWGVRIECRLAEPAEEPLEIPVDLVATRVEATG